VRRIRGPRHWAISLELTLAEAYTCSQGPRLVRGYDRSEAFRAVQYNPNYGEAHFVLGA
jgi:hypothetical protein